MTSRSLQRRIGDRVIDASVAFVLALLRPLPYATRIRAFGWVTARIIAPLAGWPRRIRDNLAFAWPDLPESEVRRLQREVPDNIGRTVMEFFSGEEVRARLGAIRLEGPGVPALEAGLAAGRPMILVSGHIGNYTIFRALMARRHGQMAALYQPLSNAPFNRRYVAAMKDNALPLFPRTRAGMADMLRHLRAGNPVAILHDQHMEGGAPLRFFDRPALTALSPAELALRHDAPLIPVYTIRQPDGISFRITVESPVPPGSPEEMMQRLNDSLERQVRAHPAQWLWTHRRWRAAQEGRV